MKESLDRILSSVPDHGFFQGKTWRWSAQPLLLSQGEIAQIEALGSRLAVFQKASNTLYRRSVKGSAPSWVAEWLERGKPDEVIRLGQEGESADAVPTLIRPDLMWTEDGFALTEIDSVPGGSGLTAWMQQVFTSEGHAVAGVPDMAQRLQSYFKDFDILISKEASDYQPELTWLYGSDRVFPAEEYVWSGAPVYRFFEMFDWMGLDRMRSGYSSGRRVDAPLKAFLEEKLWLALFWLKPLERFWRQELGARYFADLREVIPRSWALIPAEVPPIAEIPGLGIQNWQDLMDFSQKERDLVLKISGFSPHAWGSRGVVVGSDMSSTDWRTAVQSALDYSDRHPHLLQPFRKGRVIQHAYWDIESGVERVMQGRVRLCPYFLAQGKRVELLGIQASICPADKKLIHGMEDAVMVPVALRV
ncbi:MAG: hypothetical protein ACFCUX_02795 [Candidatus Methylacidiphilales bacterium]